MADEIIEIKNLKVHYPIRSGFWNRVTGYVKAVDGINLSIKEGETYGVNQQLVKQLSELKK